jgi:hypothetical protein
MDITSALVESQKSLIIIAPSHLYVLPPHSRARRNMIAVGAESMKPVRSSDSTVVRRIAVTDDSAVWLGIRMKKRKSATNAPAGKLM